MLKIAYDLHIHSCLSPCGNDDMSVNNIMNMSLIKELGVIALTDHNSCKNCPALFEAAADSGLWVIAGMELTTSEEIHMVCLFPTLDAAMEFDKYVYDKLADVKNRDDIFGSQLILDSKDNMVGKVEKLLIGATSISVDALPKLVKEYGGICYPAHIDRTSDSMLQTFGYIPPEYGFAALEVREPDKFFAKKENGIYMRDYKIIKSSDAHYLENISEPENFLEIEPFDFSSLVAAIGS